MSVKFYLNSDNTLVGTLDDDGKVTVKSLHKNLRNARRLENNINNSGLIKTASGGNLTVVKVGGVPYFVIDRVSGVVNTINQLTSFETKIFAREYSDEIRPFERFNPNSRPESLHTDIHTHFAAALPPELLISVAYGRGVIYPEWLIKKYKLDTSNLTPADGKNGYLLDQLIINHDNYDKLVAAMKLDTSEQETFNRMEETYAARGPITKNPNTFVPSLWEIACDARDNNVNYLELSLSSVISDAKQLSILDTVLPEIERQTGVKIRFLGALWRHSDKEWNEDEVERLKISQRSPYIVGCDFMGHETNPTKDIYPYIKDLAKYAILNDPTFVIRVHAGENVIFKNNVRWSLIAIEEAHRELENELHTKLPYPQVRIGHGVYGFDEQPDWDEPDWSKDISTKEFCEKMNPIIEFNMSSNLSLNNINSIDEIPIKKYLDSGIRVVLGTDGRGIYSTSIPQEMILAKRAGLTQEDFSKISQTEKQVLENEEAHFYKAIVSNKSSGSAIGADLKKIIPHYTEEVKRQHDLELEQCQERLEKLISECGAETDTQKIIEATSGKKPILITGSSHSHFPKIEQHPDQVQKIGVVFDVLVRCIDPDKAYLVTGGTNHGVEKMLHERAHEFNETAKEKIVVLGTLTEEAAKDSNSLDPKKRNSNKIDPNTITHAITPILNGKIAKRWFDLPDTVLDMIQESRGTMIAIGGGSIVGDMIMRAHNMGLSLNIMSGVEGASNDKSKTLSGNNYSFADAKELIYKLLSENKNLLKANLTKEKIDKLISAATAKEKIAMQSGINANGQ